MFDPKASAQRKLVLAFVALIGIGMMVYAQTTAFTWDEGFHLLAAQLILRGEKPYIDFFHGQTPLYAYWNAFWMLLFGQSWRVAHVLSSLASTFAGLLIADFTFTRMKAPWKLAGGITAACLFLFNCEVFTFGTVGQAYGLCLALSVIAFLLAIRSVERKSVAAAAGAGFFAGAAACSSLLTAALAPVLLGWIFFYSGQRIKKLLAFLAAGAIPFLPLFWFLIKAPVQTWFDVVRYHVAYRAANVPHTGLWDLSVVISWVDSGQALLLGALGLIGIWFIATSGEWIGHARREFYLCAWLSGVQTLYLCLTHPTFQRYFLFVVPFLSVLATVGLYAISSRLAPPGRPLIPTLAITLVLAIGLGKALYDERDAFRWGEFEQIAKKVDEVTPPGAPIWADEHVYFLTRRQPPPGMEFSYSHTVNVDPKFGALVHVVPRAELLRQIAAGSFQTIETDDDEDTIKEMGIPPLYAQHATVIEADIYWDLNKK